MTISYNWLSEYLPERIEADRLSAILTSIGLEVESMTDTDDEKKKLNGLLVGEVISCEKHPGADKLKLTSVSIGQDTPLQIVCGAPNVAVGQKVVVATVGTRLFPTEGDPFEIKKAKIRGVESEGMLCAEDEIGIGKSHEGIMVLPAESPAGADFAEMLMPGRDFIYEIGLTPNRMDAMSHLGVARDVCAYLSHHTGKNIKAKSPLANPAAVTAGPSTRTVTIEDKEGCRRYCGIRLEGIRVSESPSWLKQRLTAIGLRPVNNIVDITNFILHETGQPLHAFDDDKIRGGRVVVKTLPAGTPFVTLDKKERKLHAEDLMICDAEGPMCLAGIYGGLESGVTTETKNIFLESAWFSPSRIRRSSLHHGLRTDAATRFEKGCDIGQTAEVLKRAAAMILELAGGKPSGDVIDMYPSPLENNEIALTYDYVQKLSGKKYEPAVIKNILSALGFTLKAEDAAGIRVIAPSSKSDVHHPCDIVEEIMRIDGLDQIEIPASIRIAPSVSANTIPSAAKNRLAGMLSSLGFREIMTNSISHSALYEQTGMVTMMNSLSAEHDALRPSMMESGLQVIGFNLNRKNNDLKLFEFGKTYERLPSGAFAEKPMLALWTTGHISPAGWNQKENPAGYFYLKGIIRNIFLRLGLEEPEYHPLENSALSGAASLSVSGKMIGRAGNVSEQTLKKTDIKSHEVWYAEIDWDAVTGMSGNPTAFREISRFPAVERDLALVVGRETTYSQLRETALNLKLTQLKSIHLFDLFESDKLGQGKKSMAVRFVFQDQGKTLTDQEIETMMGRLITAFEKSIQAEIRK